MSIENSGNTSSLNFPISNGLREDVRIMCNLSTGIEERACNGISNKWGSPLWAALCHAKIETIPLH